MYPRTWRILLIKVNTVCINTLMVLWTGSFCPWIYTNHKWEEGHFPSWEKILLKASCGDIFWLAFKRIMDIAVALFLKHFGKSEFQLCTRHLDLFTGYYRLLHLIRKSLPKLKVNWHVASLSSTRESLVKNTLCPIRKTAKRSVST